MNKAFTRESTDEGEDADAPEIAVPSGKNYMTRAGWQRMKTELKKLVEVERPETVRVVSWAASNGDRSENGDYIYGKRRLRELDRRIRYLHKRMDTAEVVDPVAQQNAQDSLQIFFGATVTYADAAGAEHTISIVGIDEADPAKGRVSWISPIANALLKAREGDSVTLRTPTGAEQLEVIEIRYEDLD